MKVLVVSSYPPRHCGIGAYARAQVERMRERGDSVTVLSAPDGDGDERAELLGGAAFRRARRLAPRFDRVIVHFQPRLYYPPRRAAAKVATSLALLRLARAGNVELVVHEADRPALWRPDYLLLASAFSSARRVWFHTAAERSALERDYRARVRGALVPHTDGVRLAARASRGDARRRLGLPEEGSVFLCAGFLHPGKGYERAVRAFVTLGPPPDAALFVVGSVRDAVPANLEYARRLRELCERTPRVTLVESFVDDEAFDAWMDAADAVALPYRRSWSSGALARAQLHGTPAIVANVGGLQEQAGVDDVVFDTDDELAAAMARFLRARTAADGARP